MYVHTEVLISCTVLCMVILSDMKVQRSQKQTHTSKATRPTNLLVISVRSSLKSAVHVYSGVRYFNFFFKILTKLFLLLKKI